MGLFKNVLFLYFLMVAMIVWMVFRVNRSSRGMAILTFFFWPAAIVAVFTNWGRKGEDIRLQFGIAVFALVAIFNVAADLSTNPYIQITEEELEQIRQEDPVTAYQIQLKQMEAMGFKLSDDPQGLSDADIAVVHQAALAQQSTRVPNVEPEIEFAAAPAQIQEIPLNEIRFRSGQVRLAPANANLDIPRHFRFVAAQQLGTLAQLRGIAVSPATLGWLVHERTDLHAPSFWFVDVQFHENGNLPPPTIAELGGEQDLQWQEKSSEATWLEAGDANRQHRFAAKLLRHGTLVFRAIELDANHQELGLRATRLMAARVTPEPGWAHAEYQGPRSESSFTQWMRTSDSALMAKVEVEGSEDTDF